MRDFKYNTGLVRKEKESEKANQAKADTTNDTKNEGGEG